MTPLFSIYLLRERIRIVSPHIHGRVLDIGCGILLSQLEDSHFTHYTGIDRNPEIITWLGETYPDHQFIEQDFERSPLQVRGKFDTILLLAVVEHLSNPNFLFSQLNSRLKPQGKVIITTPTPIGIRLHAIGAKLNLVYRIAAEDHKTSYSMADLLHLLHNHGMSVKLCKRFLFSFNIMCIAEHGGD
jgi:2-polyprenyl-3-methyl-5-hydroxy-6-metoxy-1,4-benzoquinol methylase